MSETELLDIEALLAPISESSPCGTSKDSGEDAALENLFSEMRDLTSVGRKIESQRYLLESLGPSDRQEMLSSLQDKADGPQADPKWGRVAELCIEILTKHSKDTRVLVSLVESMTRIHGLRGLSAAFQVCTAMIDRFGISLYPSPEDDSTKFYCIEFLSKLNDSENLKSSFFQEEITPNGAGLSWASHMGASSLEQRSQSERDEFVQSGYLTVEKYYQEIGKVEDRFVFKSFDEVAQTALEEAKKLDAAISKNCDNRFGIGNIVDALTKLQRWFRGVVQDRWEYLESMVPKEDSETSDESGEVETSGVGEPKKTSQSSGGAMTREQALKDLLAVASYFRKTEPHSPLSYSLEQAVRWGKMPLPDLLRDLVTDDNILSEVFRRMGIQEKSENSDD